MAKPRRAGHDEPSGVTPAAAQLSRGWLIALLTAILVPWAIAAALYLRPGTASPSQAPDSRGARSEVSAEQASGVWGQLEITPVVISPPIEYISRQWPPPHAPQWYFGRTSPENLREFLAGAGLGSADLQALMATARSLPPIQGIVVTPSPDLVRRLPPDVRGRLYLRLAETPQNDDQVGAYRFFGSTLQDWLGTAPGLSPATVRLVEPLVYRANGFMFFADLDLIRPEIRDADELQRLAKRLLRQSTALVKLKLDDRSDIAAISDYWGRGGRRTDIRPLLESIAGTPGADHEIDIAHLLPPLPRQHLYRYPRLSVADFEKPLLANCLWTALNFFNDTPDDRVLDVQVAMRRLKDDYYLIQDGFQLGDILVFTDDDGNLFHVAVYLADNLVFGKNGSSYLAPWTILPMERLKGHYIENREHWHMTVHRRKDL
jgi:hypothetical protein